MIHTARQNPKFIRFVRQMRPVMGHDCPVDAESVATGVLERLWHATATGALRGDIGRYDNEVIAEMCGWLLGADRLIAMLVECGWLDECEENRLLVHDWPDHAPKHVKGNVKKLGGFLERSGAPKALPKGSPPKAPPQGTGAPNLTQPNPTEPNPTQPNVTQPNVTRGAPPRKPFKPPSVEEVSAYVAAKSYVFDPEAFVAHYAARNWKLTNGRKMADWKAACVTWQKNHRKFEGNSGNKLAKDIFA